MQALADVVETAVVEVDVAADVAADVAEVHVDSTNEALGSVLNMLR